MNPSLPKTIYHAMLTGIKAIRRARDEQRLVVFVGSGVSYNSGLPSWEKLVESMAMDLGISNFKEDRDWLTKIPQHYDRERKEKEFYDKIDQVLGGDFPVTEIHKLILELNPVHIVTMNYDDILEKGSRSNGYSFNVVRKDLDLPFAKSYRMLIKMHGDLAERNIVLKEDDYLHYSKNWPLVEAYIQSIFASSLVLFVGFSGSDVNFKNIFQRVKSILGKSSQPAYLIKHELYDRVDYEYYKEFGINLLYCNEQFIDEKHLEKCNPDFPEEGKFLQEFLSTLSAGFFNEEDYLLSMLDSLELLSKIQFPMKKSIIGVLRQYNENLWENDGYLLFENGSDFNLVDLLLRFKKDFDEHSENVKAIKSLKQPIIKEEWEKKNKEIKENKELLERRVEFQVIKLLSQIGIKGIGDGKTNSIRFVDFGFDESKMSLFLDNIFNFNYSIIDLKQLSILRKSYLYYLVNNINQASAITNKILNERESGGLDWIRLVAEGNKYYLSSFEFSNTISKNNDIINYNLFEFLRKNGIVNREFLDIISMLYDFRFVYEKLDKINRLFDQVELKREKSSVGTLQIDGNLFMLHEEVFEFWVFCNENCIMVDHYLQVKSMYRKYVEAILSDYQTLKPASLMGLQFGEISKEKTTIGVFALYCAIRYFTKSEVREALERYNLKALSLVDDSEKYLMDVFRNILPMAIPPIGLNLNPFNHFQYLKNFLVLVSHVQIGKENLSEIFKEMMKWIRIYGYGIYSELNYFIIRCDDINNNLVTMDIFLNFLENFLDHFLKSNNENFPFDDLELNPIITNIVSNILDKNKNFVWVKGENFIKLLIVKFEIEIKLNPENAIRFINIIFLPLTKILDKQSKKDTSTFLNTIVQSEYFLKESDNVLKIGSIIIKGLESKTINIDHALVDGYLYRLNEIWELEGSNPERFKNIVNAKSNFQLSVMRYEVKRLVDWIIFYSFSQKSEMFEKYPFLVAFNELALLLQNPDKFDFQKFELYWLTYLDDSLLKKYSENQYAKKIIIEKWLESKRENKNTNIILYKYFIGINLFND